MTPDDPSLTAAGDQADAAAADIAGRVRRGYELAAALGVTDWSYSGASSAAERSGPRARVVAKVQQRIEGQALQVCEHLAGLLVPAAFTSSRAPEAAFWLSWHPDLLSCGACVITLPAPDETEDRRCDGCGRVTAPGEPMTVGSEVIRAQPAAGGARLAPPLICSYGLCQRCTAASGMPPGPGRARRGRS